MNNYLNVLACSAMIIFLLTGCGGGGDGSGGATRESQAATPVPIPESQATNPGHSSSEPRLPEPNSTAELISSEDFLLNPSALLTVNIQLNELMYERAYLNICHVDSQDEMNFDNCLVKSPLRGGRYNHELTIANDVNVLEMQIWRYSVTQEPFTYRWERRSGMTWVVES